jgi:polysaccharide biosynthesis protein PslG
VSAALEPCPGRIPLSARTTALALSAVLALSACGGASQEQEPDEPDARPSVDVAGEPVAACAPDDRGGALPETYWGMHVAQPVGEDFPEAPIGAVNLTTSQTYWNQIEVAPGTYEFDRLDAIVETSEDRGARPVLVMGFTPSFHAEDPSSPTARANMPDLNAWKAWVRAVVERYGDQLDYQIWPEPNIVGNWTGTPEQMAELTVAAGEVIHEVEPEALVVAPATTLRMESQRDWMDRFWAADVDGVPVAESVDAVALDPFPVEDGTPEDSLDLLCQAQQILDDHDVDLPVWTNEINYGVPSGGPSADKDQTYADDLQAAVVARTYLMHAAVGVDRVYWLGWFSYPALAVEMIRDEAETPAARAYRMVHDWMQGEGRPECRVESGVYTCAVVRDGDPVRVYWTETKTATVPAPEGATRLQTLAGDEQDVAAGDAVEVTESPVAVFAD